MVWFPDLNAKSEGIFFKYLQGWKARAIPEKAFVSGGDFKPSFWNIEQVAEAKPGTVFITEGECDALSLIEAGLSPCQVLSVPTGARQRASEDPREAKGYQYVFDALRSGLGAAKRIIWCGDADEAGQALRADMVQLLGVPRFAYVDWPQGVNDPNAMLVKHGPDGLRQIVLSAKLWPQDGLFRLSELPTPPPLTLWVPSLPGFEGRVHLAPKTLSVVTGQPGHGKTILWNQIFYDLAQRYELIICNASFETRPKPHIRRQLRTLITGKLEIELSEQEANQADSWIEDHYLFLTHHEQRPTLEWLLDCAETAVIRHGARVIQIDPWNRLEAMREKNESETEYILRCLRAMYVFASDMDCHMQVIAHPAKMDGHRRGQPPTLEDISSSKHWENVVDQGFTVHRPQMYEGTSQRTLTDFYHRKSRFSELGYPCKIGLNYDLATHKYVSLLSEPQD